MQKINDFPVTLDGFLGGHVWFMLLLIGTGLFFTIYLGFPQTFSKQYPEEKISEKMSKRFRD